MNYVKITEFDIANGPGIRTVLWVAGCIHHCRGCHNPMTHNAFAGQQFTEEDMEKILDSIAPNYIDGITLSGGDPLYPENISTIKDIIESVKEEYPEKTIWLYTGYTYEYLRAKFIYERDIYYILDKIDVLVDGKYIEKLRDISLPYCGSSNQRVIDMKKTRAKSRLVLYK